MSIEWELMATRGRLEKAKELLAELASELESEIRHRYGEPVHPAQQTKFELDMESVRLARRFLQRTEAHP